MRGSFRQSIMSALGGAVGGLPGFLCWWLLGYGVGWAVFVAALGVFIGLALTLPGVSGKRILGATAGWVVAHNTGWYWGKKVYETIAGDDQGKRIKNPQLLWWQGLVA
jgi:hypothetical protein